jgi:hypothetical protein
MKDLMRKEGKTKAKFFISPARTLLRINFLYHENSQQNEKELCTLQIPSRFIRLACTLIEAT